MTAQTRLCMAVEASHSRFKSSSAACSPARRFQKPWPERIITTRSMWTQLHPRCVPLLPCLHAPCIVLCYQAALNPLKGLPAVCYPSGVGMICRLPLLSCTAAASPHACPASPSCVPWRMRPLLPAMQADSSSQEDEGTSPRLPCVVPPMGPIAASTFIAPAAASRRASVLRRAPGSRMEGWMPAHVMAWRGDCEGLAEALRSADPGQNNQQAWVSSLTFVRASKFSPQLPHAIVVTDAVTLIIANYTPPGWRYTASSCS